MDSKTKTIVDLTAYCACAKANIKVHGPVLTTMLCACTECQRASGAGHVAVAMVPKDALTITGTTKVFTRAADSGATFSRTFCGDCGTWLYSATSRSPDIALLPMGLFPGSDWYHPRQIIFNKSRTHWDCLPDDIPAYDTYREA